MSPNTTPRVTQYNKEASMKYLGNVKTLLINEKEDYKGLFDPLTDAELSDLRESIRASGIINNLIVERTGKGYVLLSGHHRKQIAAELGLDEVPCSLVETQNEKIEALFDNANRRQLTEQRRKEMIKLKMVMTRKFYSDGLIPELYKLLETKKIKASLADRLICLSTEDQQAILESLTVEPKTVPKEVQKKHEDEKARLVETHQNEIGVLIKKYEGTIESLTADLTRSRDRLNVLTQDKKRVEESLRENNRTVESLKTQVKQKLDELEEKKGTLTVEVRKEFEAQITVLVKERETRETAIKTKQDEISKLNESITSLKNKIDGLESKSKLWELECHRLAEQYNKTVQHYSNPALVEVQLQVVSELVEALIRFVKNHKWDEDTLKMSDKYRKDLDEQMVRLSKEIRTNQKEVLTAEGARTNVEKALQKGRPQLKSVKKAAEA